LSVCCPGGRRATFSGIDGCAPVGLAEPGYVFISFTAFTGSTAGIYLFVATQGCWLVAIVFFLGIILITVGITVARRV